MKNYIYTQAIFYIYFVFVQLIDELIHIVMTKWKKVKKKLN